MAEKWREVGIGRIVQGTICGLKRKEIKNIEDIKCPICGEPMQITELSMSDNVDRYNTVTGICGFLDDANIRHRFVYGREVTKRTYPVTLSCHNQCAEVKIMLTNIQIGFDKTLRHEVSRPE